MANPKRILVVCGTGIGNATLVANRVKAALQEHGVSIVTCACQAEDAEQQASEFQPDCVISTAYVDGCLPFPVFRGLPFLSGVKDEEALSELIHFLREPARPAL